MADTAIQEQINEINRKLDLVLQEVNAQRLKREEVQDLVSDLSIISEDVFTNTVTTLDNAGVEMDYDALSNLLIRFVRNIGTFNDMFETLESAADLVKDLGPIVNQVGFDAIDKMAELEKKGYITFITEITKVMDAVVHTYNDMDAKDVPEYSMWKAFRAMNTPEMKRGMGFMITFMQQLSKTLENK